MPKSVNVVGRNVAKFRYQAGWTQERLAAKMQLRGCQITRDIIANIESGRSPVTDIWILRLAEVLKVEIVCLFPQKRSNEYGRRPMQLV